MSVNRTVTTLLGRTHVAVILDLSLMLMKGLVMVRKKNYSLQCHNIFTNP